MTEEMVKSLYDRIELRARIVEVWTSDWSNDYDRGFSEETERGCQEGDQAGQRDDNLNI